MSPMVPSSISPPKGHSTSPHKGQDSLKLRQKRQRLVQHVNNSSRASSIDSHAIPSRASNVSQNLSAALPTESNGVQIFPAKINLPGFRMSSLPPSASFDKQLLSSIKGSSNRIFGSREVSPIISRFENPAFEDSTEPSFSCGK